MSDEAPAKKNDARAPAWVMTFADLMSLLMCFFVLLLSFSEMDVSKYKEMAGSLKNAFGVQRELQVKEPPKGINVIAREFSPGRPDPTPMNVIRQMTTSDHEINLYLGKRRKPPTRTPRDDRDPEATEDSDPSGQAEELTESEKQELKKAKQLAAARLDEKLASEESLEAALGQERKMKGATMLDDQSLEELVKAKVAAERLKKLEQSAKLISNALGKEIKAGSVDVETAGQKIIIRVREKASFGSGRAELKAGFKPLLGRVASILKDSEGKIIIAGHTDNVPIYTERYRSNWELSAARAVSVAHAMMDAIDIPSERFLVQGFADTQPMAKNDSVANRAANRRVEIVLLQGEDKESGEPAISGDKAVETPPEQGQTLAVGKQSSAKPAVAVQKGDGAGNTLPPKLAPAPSGKAKAAPSTVPPAAGVRVGGVASKPAPAVTQAQQPASPSIRIGGSK